MTSSPLLRSARVAIALSLFAACDHSPSLDAGTEAGVQVDAGVDAGSDGCAALADCPADSVACDFPEGTCTGVGRCVSLPTDCPAFDPQCGCDGVTYEGPCQRLSAGVSLRSDGACP